MSRTNPRISESEYDSFYKKLSREIYRENKQNKEMIKSNFLTNNNPITHNEKKISNQPVFPSSRIKSYRKNMTSENISSKSSGKLPINSNNNLFKTSYEISYSKNKIENEKKKTNKKLIQNSLDFFSSHNNITGNQEKIFEDKKTLNSKKLFRSIYDKKSLSNLYRGNIDIETKHEIIQPDILHPFSTKKHFSKVEPTKETLWINDKRKLLPAEVKQRHFRGNSFSSNLLKVPKKTDNNIIQNIIDEKFSKEVKRRKYPYAEDSIGKLIHIGNNNKEQYITDKINKNSFHVLRDVPRYDWEF